MICPAILDPFQGTNYRLIACLHQMLLCPIISKFLGYVFSPVSIQTSELMASDKCELQQNINKLVKNSLSSHEVKDIKSFQMQNTVHHILNDINNTNTKALYTKTALHIECNNANGVNGKKKIENGCDIGIDALIQCSNDSNKKSQ